MAGGAPQQGQADNSMGYFWILVAVFLAIFAIWYFAHSYIAYAYLRLKLLEIDFISFFTDHLKVVKHWIELVPVKNVKFSDVSTIANLVGSYFRIPVSIFLLILAVIVYRSNPVRGFKKTYNMRRLINTEKAEWPTINPITKDDLQKIDLMDGPWSMALTPMEFAKKYKLLQEETKPLEEGKLQREVKITVTVLRGRANKVFTMQLGRPWTGGKTTPIHVKALFAIFAARANRDRSNADKLLTQLSSTSAGGAKGINFSGAEELFNKHVNTKLIKQVLDRHAYTLTVMASMLELARIDGVLATAEFLWLKPLDRRLWYILNNVGRQTGFTEVAGAFSHWLAEKELGQKIISPMIDGATNALEEAISEVVYIPDEKEEDDG